MINFEIKFIEKRVKINNEDYTVKLMKISPLVRAEFQAKLLNSDTCTIGALQNGDAKVNLDILAKKDLYLLAYVVKKIEEFNEYEAMSFRQKLDFYESFANVNPDEFEKFLNDVKSEVGDLL